MRPHASIGLESATTCRSNRSAFTRAELVATLGAIFLFSVILLPSFANHTDIRAATRSDQVGCLNNLRQIGIAFQTWGNEHDDWRPWFVDADVNRNQGGTRGHPQMNNTWIQFSTLSNHMSPRLLSDPCEIVPNKRVAENWSFSPAGGFMNAGFRDNAVSYMLGVHAMLPELVNILSADRNVAFDGVSGCSYGFTQVLRVNFLTTSFRGWTNGNHGTFGNVLLNDGRVEFTSSARLQALLRRADDAGDEHFLSPFN